MGEKHNEPIDAKAAFDNTTKLVMQLKAEHPDTRAKIDIGNARYPGEADEASFEDKDLSINASYGNGSIDTSAHIREGDTVTQYTLKDGASPFSDGWEPEADEKKATVETWVVKNNRAETRVRTATNRTFRALDRLVKIHADRKRKKL